MTPSGSLRSGIQVAKQVLMMPLVSAAEIAGVLGRDVSGVHGALRDLKGAGVLGAVTLGWLGHQAERYYLPEDRLRDLGLDGATWHQPGSLIRLLERFPSVPWLYRVVASFGTLGRMTNFEWVDDAGFDAAVKYETAWIILVWMGLLRSESGIAERIKRCGRDLAALGVGDPHPSPGQVCCVVPDRFQVELVLRVARRYGMEDWISVWCINDGSWHGARECLPSRGWFHQPVYRREKSHEAWQGQVRRSQWSWEGNRSTAALLERVQPVVRDAVGDNLAAARLMKQAREAIKHAAGPGEAALLLQEFTKSLDEEGAPAEAAQVLARVARSGRQGVGSDEDYANILLAVAEWPGIPTTMVGAILGEGPGGRRGQRSLVRLVDYGLLIRWRDGREYRYRLTWKGMVIMAKGDRVSPGDAWGRIKMGRWEDLDGFQVHEYGLLQAVEQFIASGCTVFAGWRDTEGLGHGGGIDPDAVVLLRLSPYGPGPAYLEYERSADRPSKIEAKLGGYDSPQRGNNWPVLFVCHDGKMERLFWEIGAEMGIPLLTTTGERLKKHGPLHNRLCWSRYGDPAELG